MVDPILLLFILFHAWDGITFAWIWWKGTDPDKKAFIKAEVKDSEVKDSRELALVA